MEKCTKSLKTLISRIIKMVKKNFQVQLFIFGVIITTLIVLARTGIKFNIPVLKLNIFFAIPTSFLISLIFILFVPIGVMGYFEFFYNKKEYDENVYYKVARGIWHLFFLIIGGVILAIIIDLIYFILIQIAVDGMAEILSIIILLLILVIVYNYFKSKGINIYNPFTWVK